MSTAQNEIYHSVTDWVSNYVDFATSKAIIFLVILIQHTCGVSVLVSAIIVPLI